MPDKVSELWDLGDGATVRLHGRVNKVYQTQSGEGQYGPWYRTDLDFSDETGKVKIGWFHNDSPQPPLQVQGATVRVEGTVKTFRKRDNSQGLGVTGKSVELADVQGGSANPPPQQGGAPPQQPRQQSTPPRQGAMTDEEWIAWARPMLGELTTLYRSHVPGDAIDANAWELESAILGAAQATLVHCSISMEHGNLTPTLGRQAAPGRRMTQGGGGLPGPGYNESPGDGSEVGADRDWRNGGAGGGSLNDPADDGDIPF